MAENGRIVHLVDDDEAIRRSASFMLRTSGYLVKTYASGVEFLGLGREVPPGVILMDVRMPQIDGLEVQRALRKNGVLLPVIVMTGHGDVTVAVEAMKNGSIDFIEKPFEKKSLITAIDEGFARIEQSGRRRARAEEAKVRLEALTPREAEVLEGLARGHPNKTIAFAAGLGDEEGDGED